MKYFLITYFTFLIPYSINSGSDNYKWELVLKPGNGSFETSWKEGQWPMGISACIAFDDQLWMTGQKKVWSSGNGIHWTASQKTDWGERHGMATVFFKNKLWMLGGMKTWDDFRNDTWHSDDGKKWVQAVTNASWSKRRDHQVFTYKNKLWLIGGVASSGKVNELPTIALSDTWSSDDGIHWNLISNSAPWQGKGYSKILVFNNKIWLVGTESWYSEDGKTWTKAAFKNIWPNRRSNGVLVFDNKLWVYGGIELNDVWHSSNGTDWNKLNNAPWTPRTTNYSTVFKNKLWIYSGKTGKEDSWSGDIWTLEYKPNN